MDVFPPLHNFRAESLAHVVSFALGTLRGDLDIDRLKRLGMALSREDLKDSLQVIRETSTTLLTQIYNNLHSLSLPSPTLSASSRYLFVPPEGRDEPRYIDEHLIDIMGFYREMVVSLIDQGRIYEPLFGHSRICFTSCDFSGTVRGVHERTLNRFPAHYHDIEGSSPLHTFTIPGQRDDTILVFSDHYEALAHATLQQQVGIPWDKVTRLAYSELTAPAIEQ
ncbi:MAG: hypothetical protein FWE76_00610 [Symbiobacteriaceae bacterium]|nr:hypothetical protein [Symbiobacteriaceae bacterium]